MNEAELLLSYRFGTDRAGLYRKRKQLLSKEDGEFVSAVLKRRAFGEPLQYILGKADFFGLELKVSASVLIPRPETELLVEEALVLSAQYGPAPAILDIGTGSGCIAVALGTSLPRAAITALDISEPALAIAGENVRAHAPQVRLVKSDCFSAVSPKERFDIIISNPPYIKSSQIKELQPEVQYEPVRALDGGPDGLDFYRRLAGECRPFLKSGAAVILEIGHDQKQAIEKIFSSKGYGSIGFIKDYNGMDRVAVIENFK